jgi:hypothetical protein
MAPSQKYSFIKIIGTLIIVLSSWAYNIHADSILDNVKFLLEVDYSDPISFLDKHTNAKETSLPLFHEVAARESGLCTKANWVNITESNISGIIATIATMMQVQKFF